MHPVLFEIPGLGWPIFSYGVMLGLSMIAGWYLTLYFAEKDGFDRGEMANGVVYSILAALVGARLLYVVVNPSHFSSFGELLNVRQGGLVAYGGFLGGLLTSWIYCRWKGVRLLAWADAAIPTLAVGLFVTRIGCFLYGCDYGRRITDSDPGWLRAIAVRFPSWAARYPHIGDGGAGGLCSQDMNGAPAFTHHVAAYGLDPSAAESFAVVPTQLISSLNGLVLLGVLMLVRRYRTFRGQMLLTFGVYYGVTRFFIELVRDDTQRGLVGPRVFGPLGAVDGQLTTSQIIAAVTAISSIVAWGFLQRRARRDPEAAMSIGTGPGAARPETEGARKVSRPRRRGGAKKKSKR